MGMSKQLQQAIEYYANAYVSTVVGTSIEEGRSAAEQIAHEFKYRWIAQGCGVFPYSNVADYVISEANAFEC